MESPATRALGSLVAPWSPWAAIQPSLLRSLLGFGAFLCGFAIAYHFGMSFSPTISAPFWFPDSVLLCALLCTKRRNWWWLLAATLPIRLLVDMPPGTPGWFLVAVWLNDCLKAALAAWLLRRFLADPIRLTSLHDLGVYIIATVALVPVLSALAGAVARVGLGRPFGPNFEQWLLGDAMASLVVTPILFYWILRPPNPATFSPMRIVEAGVMFICLLVTLTFAFEPGSGPHDLAETRYYAPLPFMVWAAIRFRMFGATAVVAALSYFAVDAAFNKVGSFAGYSDADIAGRMQHFLLLRVAPLYLAAVLIEQWHRVSASLRESEQRFRNIANQAPTMMWTSGIDGGADFINRSWLEFTGRTLEDSLGHRWAESLHPDDYRRAFDEYQKAFHDRKPLEMEIRVRRHDGEYRWTLSLGVPRFGADGEFLGYVGSAIDLTERRQQEAALRRSEARYREVVESQSVFVCRLLPDGTLTFVNSAYCRDRNKSRMELLGESFLSQFPAAGWSAAREALARTVATDEPTTWECEVAAVDGTRRWQSWTCHVIPLTGDEVRELQAVGSDITDRRRAEESGRQLAYASRFAALGELTAMVAHEINQPLCAILSNAEAAEILLRSNTPPLEELREILADIRKDDLRADSAIRSIRSLVQRREYLPRPVRFTEVIEHVIKLVSGDALHRRVRLRCELEADLPVVMGDRSHLEQVLVILIGNAMDAMKQTPEGTREVTIGARRAPDNLLEVTVRDRGHGVAAENMPQLFDSLFTTKPDGMGLGLPIARTMIAAHGGRIWAENAPDGGALFRFTLTQALAPAGM